MSRNADDGWWWWPPLEEYEELGFRLVMGGEEKGVYEEADYLKLNTGLMLLRVRAAPRRAAAPPRALTPTPPSR